jgi:hypothetical protein
VDAFRWDRRATSLRRRDLGRLRHCAIQIGEIEPWTWLSAIGVLLKVRIDVVIWIAIIRETGPDSRTPKCDNPSQADTNQQIEAAHEIRPNYKMLPASK